MYVIRARNVHQALPEVLYSLKQHGVKRDSRNGPVLRFPEPCTVVYEKPQERVIFWKERDANPTFHLLESLWMLAGRNDVQFLSDLVARMTTFSDDGETFHGAYGYRWRNHFRTVADKPGARSWVDQVLTIGHLLKENPDCRRQVLAMWDPTNDLGFNSKDIPCNTHAYFSRNDTGALDMMVCNRSNDIVWGALGANAVHFSILQEFMAALIGCEMGRYWQTSNNMHLYLNTHGQLMEEMAMKAFPSTQAKVCCLYEQGMSPTPLVAAGESAANWLSEVEAYLDVGPVMGIASPFLRKVVTPLSRAYSIFKNSGDPKRLKLARDEARNCPAVDWWYAADEWYDRREKRAEQKLSDTQE